MEYFSIVTRNLNKYVRYHLNNVKFGTMKWINITVQDMFHLYGVMLWISIEPWNLGGYTS